MIQDQLRFFYPEVVGQKSEVKLHPIRAIIFDCDGTLVDSEYSYFLSIQRSFQRRGENLTIHEYSSFVGNPKGIDEKFITQKMGKNCAYDILNEAMAHYLHLQTLGLSPIQATLDFLHSLNQRKEDFDLKLGLASASDRNDILINLRNLEIEDYFDIILSGRDDLHHYTDPEGVNKPKPYIYLEAAKALNLSPKECIVIEDSFTGVTASVNAGCFTVAIPNQITELQDLSNAHLILDSFQGMEVEEFLEKICERRD